MATEVPAALTIDECWQLVNTAERTRRHCIQLENCIYDFFEITLTGHTVQMMFGLIGWSFICNENGAPKKLKNTVDFGYLQLFWSTNYVANNRELQ